jgi:20S proteasome subunit alpha 3
VVLAAEKKETSSLFVPTRESGKLYKMDDHILVSVSGVVADANMLIDQGRLHSQRHIYSQGSPIYVEQLVRHLADTKHVYTQMGSSRPFGVSLMYAGWDAVQGFQLYCSDPSGNYAAWKAHATGKNSVNAISSLKDDYTEELTLQQGTIMAAKVLGKSMDINKPDTDRFEIGVITRDASGNVIQRRVEGAELTNLLTEARVFEDIEAAKK